MPDRAANGGGTPLSVSWGSKLLSSMIGSSKETHEQEENSDQRGRRGAMPDSSGLFISSPPESTLEYSSDDMPGLQRLDDQRARENLVTPSEDTTSVGQGLGVAMGEEPGKSTVETPSNGDLDPKKLRVKVGCSTADTPVQSTVTVRRKYRTAPSAISVTSNSTHIDGMSPTFPLEPGSPVNVSGVGGSASADQMSRWGKSRNQLPVPLDMALVGESAHLGRPAFALSPAEESVFVTSPHGLSSGPVVILPPEALLHLRGGQIKGGGAAKIRQNNGGGDDAGGRRVDGNNGNETTSVPSDGNSKSTNGGGGEERSTREGRGEGKPVGSGKAWLRPESPHPTTSVTVDRSVFGSDYENDKGGGDGGGGEAVDEGRKGEEEKRGISLDTLKEQLDMINIEEVVPGLDRKSFEEEEDQEELVRALASAQNSNNESLPGMPETGAPTTLAWGVSDNGSNGNPRNTVSVPKGERVAEVVAAKLTSRPRPVSLPLKGRGLPPLGGGHVKSPIGMPSIVTSVDEIRLTPGVLPGTPVAADEAVAASTLPKRLRQHLSRSKMLSSFGSSMSGMSFADNGMDWGEEIDDEDNDYDANVHPDFSSVNTRKSLEGTGDGGAFLAEKQRGSTDMLSSFGDSASPSPSPRGDDHKLVRDLSRSTSGVLSYLHAQGSVDDDKGAGMGDIFVSRVGSWMDGEDEALALAYASGGRPVSFTRPSTWSVREEIDEDDELGAVWMTSHAPQQRNHEGTWGGGEDDADEEDSGEPWIPNQPPRSGSHGRQSPDLYDEEEDLSILFEERQRNQEKMLRPVSVRSVDSIDSMENLPLQYHLMKKKTPVVQTAVTFKSTVEREELLKAAKQKQMSKGGGVPRPNSLGKAGHSSKNRASSMGKGDGGKTQNQGNGNSVLVTGSHLPPRPQSGVAVADREMLAKSRGRRGSDDNYRGSSDDGDTGKGDSDRHSRRSAIRAKGRAISMGEGAGRVYDEELPESPRRHSSRSCIRSGGRRKDNRQRTGRDRQHGWTEGLRTGTGITSSEGSHASQGEDSTGSGMSQRETIRRTRAKNRKGLVLAREAMTSKEIEAEAALADVVAAEARAKAALQAVATDEARAAVEFRARARAKAAAEMSGSQTRRDRVSEHSIRMSENSIRMSATPRRSQRSKSGSRNMPNGVLSRSSSCFPSICRPMSKTWRQKDEGSASPSSIASDSPTRSRSRSRSRSKSLRSTLSRAKSAKSFKITKKPPQKVEDPPSPLATSVRVAREGQALSLTARLQGLLGMSRDDRPQQNSQGMRPAGVYDPSGRTGYGLGSADGKSRGQSWARGLVPIGNRDNSSSDEDEEGYCWDSSRPQSLVRGDRDGYEVYQEALRDDNNELNEGQPGDRLSHLFKLGKLHGHRISGVGGTDERGEYNLGRG
ncbi:unnamed protein product [Choristocarpus tenellus]